MTRRVLFVEDEKALRGAYQRYFAQRYQMAFAGTGAEGHPASVMEPCPARSNRGALRLLAARLAERRLDAVARALAR